jgi:hypothetical protein
MVAKPDVAEFDLHNEDIILLCSDGLCGVLRDNEIEYFIKNNQTSMNECRDALWEGSRQVGWTDNTTVVLAQVVSGAATIVDEKEEVVVAETNKGFKTITVFILAILCLFLGASLTFVYVKRAKIVELWNKVEMVFTLDEDVDGLDLKEGVDVLDTVNVDTPSLETVDDTEESNYRNGNEEKKVQKKVNQIVDNGKVADTFNEIPINSDDKKKDTLNIIEENTTLDEVHDGDNVGNDSSASSSENEKIEEVENATINV